MIETPSFNLIDQNWIEVRWLDGRVSEESITSVFAHASEIREITGELPTQAFAIFRVLLAILQRAVITADDFGQSDNPSQVWGELWRMETIPPPLITTYLERWYDRFYLLGGEAPFMQVAGLQTTSGDVTNVGKIIAEVPDGHQFFTTRSGHQAESVSPAEAARWLIHTQAYDTAGIKSGVIGDPLVKGGKKYPVGTGWAGRIGGIYAVGSTLKATMLLNLCLAEGANHGEWSRFDDLPVWERPSNQPSDSSRQPTGPADLFTWQARWISLVPSAESVTGVVLTNANKLETHNRFNLEPLSGWRRSLNQQKTLKLPEVFMPAEHQVSRAMWRGLESLLPVAQTAARADVRYLPPGIISWLAYLSSDDGGSAFDALPLLVLRSVGVSYGPQSSTFSEIIDDHLSIHASLLTPQAAPLVNLAKECVADTDTAVWHLGQLAANLHLAAGGDSQSSKGPRDLATEQAYSAIDAEFRDWLRSLDAAELDPSALDAYIAQCREEWHVKARKILANQADRMLSETSPQAFTGHASGSQATWMTSSQADRFFRGSLRKALPIASDQNPAKSTDGKK